MIDAGGTAAGIGLQIGVPMFVPAGGRRLNQQADWEIGVPFAGRDFGIEFVGNPFSDADETDED